MDTKGVITIKYPSPHTAVINIDGAIGFSPDDTSAGDEYSTTSGTNSTAVSLLDRIRNMECDRVRVNIRSTGGNLSDAVSLYEALCELPALVETHCYGYVASAATIIAQAASVDSRYLSSGCLYLVHNSTTAAQGNKDQVLRTVDLLAKSDDQVAEIYAERSGRPLEGFKTLMSAANGDGRWLTAEEAVELGLADHVETLNPLRKAGRRLANFVSSLFPVERFTDGVSDSYATSAPSPAKFSTKVSARTSPKTNAMAILAAERLRVENRELQTRIINLECEAHRSAALPTLTCRKNDPFAAPTGAPNQSAYHQDAMNLFE